MKERLYANLETLGPDWERLGEESRNTLDYFIHIMELSPSKCDNIVTVKGIQIQTGNLRPFKVGDSIALFNRRGPNNVTFVDIIRII